MKKILSIDGGGIRGIIPAFILSELEARTGKPAYALFDMIAGTSTGGIIAIGVSCKKPGSDKPYSAAEMMELYEKEGQNIFDRTFWSDLKSGWGLWGSKYDNRKGLSSALNKYFRTTRIKDALTEILIPAYEIERRTPYLFKRSKAQTEKNGDFSAVDVCLATSAAPVYFPAVKVPTTANGSIYCVDGGLFANNPAADAVTEARKLWPGEELLVVSLGTGRSVRRLPYDKASGWGAAKWIGPLLDTLFDATAMDTDYRLSKELPADSYFRIQADLDESLSEMSNVSEENIEALKSFAGGMVDSNDERLNRLAARLLK